jgi:uncharacterized membrane protein YhiD involved in acid resistance
MPYDRLDLASLILYIAAIGLIAFIAMEYWSFAILFVLILIITALHKIMVMRDIDALAKDRKIAISNITNNLDRITEKIDDVKKAMHNELVSISNELAREQEVNIDRHYGTITEKLIEMDNKLSQLRRRLEGQA